MAQNGKIIAVSISRNKGEKKTNVASGKLIEGFGLEGDIHGGDWHRQISLLGTESIEKINQMGLSVLPGNFAENITTQGLDLMKIPLGTKLKVGDEALLEVTQIGKECQHPCRIYEQVGDCVMPSEGIFARVLQSGNICPGDVIEIISCKEKSCVQSGCADDQR